MNYHRLTTPHVYEDQACFCTKTFFIRYAEEIVIFRDIIRFRTEVDTSIPNYIEMPFYLKVELYWLPAAVVLTDTQIQSKDIKDYLAQSQTASFTMVQSHTIQLNNAMQGLSSYIPLHFDQEFTCFASFTIHSNLLQFKYRPRGTSATNQYVENGVIVLRKKENGEPEKEEAKDTDQNVKSIKFH